MAAHFHGEQEHLIFIEKPDGTPILDFNVYSLKPDLYRLRPFKGDFHIHTTGSDGQECPEYVAARYREEGFDFIAITDHRQYGPSLTAIDCWKAYRTGLKLYPGEDDQPPEGPVHIVNLGGSVSNNEIFRRTTRFRGESSADSGWGRFAPGSARSLWPPPNGRLTKSARPRAGDFIVILLDVRAGMLFRRAGRQVFKRRKIRCV